MSDEARYELIDEALAPVHAFVGALVAFEAPQWVPGFDYAMMVDEYTLDLPIELDVVTPEASGELILGGSPPTQYTETTFLPVFHRLRMHVVSEPKPHA